MSRKRYPLRVTRGASGIRAQDLRTLAKAAWWGRRWIASLEEMRLGARFGRGRQYAVSGQVTELVIDGPHVEATVVGSRAEPYRLSFAFSTPEPAARERIAAALKREPMLLARLLTDDLPIEIEALFREENAWLFPQAQPIGKTDDGRPLYDVRMKCSCPDWARPCKHLVAALLLVGEEVARHPSVLLALRGVELDDLIPADEKDGEQEEGRITVSPVPGRAFSAGARSQALLKRLGPVPFWRGTVRCMEALGKIYTRQSHVAQEAAEGRSIDLRGMR
jgi:uncharacterized Zn finger protein